MAPRPDVSEERKSQILDAAVRVLTRRGYAATRMDDIVAEAEISKGLLYWYFKSKDAVLAAMVKRLFAPEMRALRELPGRQGSARERLVAFAVEAAREVATMVRVVPVTFELYTIAFRNRTVRKAMNEFFDAYLTSVREVIRQGVEAGEFPGASPAQAAISLAAVLEGVLLLWVFDNRVGELATQIRSGVELIIRGLESGRSKT